jgi:hypothetical protein
MSNACGALSVYSFANVAVTIDDREVKGLWEGDDVVSVERQTVLGTPLVGADGASVVSITADQSARLTLRLMPNSAMNVYLNQVAKLQRAGVTRTLRVAIRDTSNGEGGGCSAAMVVEEPNWSLGAAATSRDWVIWCSCWQSNDITYRPIA